MKPERAGGGVLLYCRSGFEKECAAEIIHRAAALGAPGYVRTEADSGYVTFFPLEGDGLDALKRGLRFDDLIFARQWVFSAGLCDKLPTDDRITPLLEAAKGLAPRFSDVVLETADTNEAKALSVFVRKFAAPFRRALERAEWLGAPGLPKLHIFFLSATSAYVGMSQPGNASPWPMGIPRLKFPRGAPSRSTLKLDEAFQVFVNDPEQDLRPGMTAVDLGAAPGGWTYQLVRRHIRTIAVDNGRLDASLLESGIVEHLQADGFRYRPAKPVDWLVCDMVEQPSRIAALVADWLSQGLCRHAIFNLKLPMKKRYEAVMDGLALVEERLIGANVRYRLSCKQLYHDRAEVTGYVSRRDG